MKLLKFFGKAVLFLIIAAVIILGVNEQMNKKVVLKEYIFRHWEVPKAFEGYKIMVISDLHNAPFSDMIIKHIEAVKPDIIAFTGDMVQLPGDNPGETLKIAKAFSDKIPMYAISGNHETQNESYWDIMEAMSGEGIITVENDSVCLEKGNDTMLLIGIKDPESDFVDGYKIKKIQKQIKSEFPDGPCFSVLLNHRADLYPSLKDTGVDLILSGHLHGGVVRLPFLGGLAGQDGELFPDYEYGYIKEGDSASMIVSGGCDKNPEKKRFFNPPEVILIRLEGEA